MGIEPFMLGRYRARKRPIVPVGPPSRFPSRQAAPSGVRWMSKQDAENQARRRLCTFAARSVPLHVAFTEHGVEPSPLGRSATDEADLRAKCRTLLATRFG